MTKKEAYEFLYRLAEGIARMFGVNCETVVQEVIDSEVVTLAIFNGHVSGRQPMSQVGILGGILSNEDIDYEEFMTDVHNQLVIHPSGKKIKSSSFILSGKHYKYVLGINYDVSLLDKVETMLGSFLAFEGDLYATLQRESDNSMESILENSLKSVNYSAGKLKKEERIILLQVLKEQHFFDLQKSVPFLAEKLSVSKYTIYKDLKEITQMNEAV